MKKMLILLVILMICSSFVFAQTESKGDTLLVGPLNSEGVALGALNEAIHGDTTASGERVHSVYKLERNAQYILTEVIQADFPLTIVADKSDESNRPPIIRCGLKEDGSTVDNWWILYAGATFRNVWMTGINLDGNGPISWISQQVHNEGNRYVYDGCIIEYPYTWWANFLDDGLNNSYIFTDNIFQYIGNPTGATWNGAIMNGGTMDTVLIRNNTYYNFGCFAFNGLAYYLEIDHNTFVNSVVHPLNSHTKIIGKYTNNLFVNCHAYSDDYDEIRRHHDVEVKGIMNYAEIQWDPLQLDSLYGPGGAYGKSYDPNGDGHLTEGELIWELKNNNWFYTQPIVDYWNKFPQVITNPWMNNYNKAMFESNSLTEDWTWDLKVYVWADSTGSIVENPPDFTGLHIVDSVVVSVEHEPFKYYSEENTTNLDPGIIDMNGTDELLAQNCINMRNSDTENPVNFHGVDDYLAFDWPLDYNLRYTNTTLEHGGTDGKPVGSLIWWPEYEYVTDVKKENVLPDGFALEQNYPNPFNPTTNIKFAIPNSSVVSLKIFNVLGQEVATLLNKQMSAGSYTVDFNAANLSSGLYIYRLEAGSFTSAKKMMLMK